MKWQSRLKTLSLQLEQVPINTIDGAQSPCNGLKLAQLLSTHLLIWQISIDMLTHAML